MGSKDQVWVLMLAQQAFYQLSHLPNFTAFLDFFPDWSQSVNVAEIGLDLLNALPPSLVYSGSRLVSVINKKKTLNA